MIKRYRKWMLACGVLFSTSVMAQLSNFTQYRNDGVEQSKEYQKGNNYQKDFLLFVDLLEDTHPAFAEGRKPPFSIRKLRDTGYRWAENCQSEKDFTYYLLQALSPLNDGHTTVYSNFFQGKRYPLTVVDLNGQLAISSIDPTLEQHLGRLITHINGVEIDDVISQFGLMMPFTNDIHVRSQFCHVISSQTIWENSPLAASSKKLELTLEGGVNVVVPTSDGQSKQLSNWKPVFSKADVIRTSRLPFSYKRVNDLSLCYLQFSQCIDKNSARAQLRNAGMPVEQIEERVAHILDFNQFLDSMFQDMTQNNINTLVIDVRSNGGGNSMLCDQLMSRLKQRYPDRQMQSSMRISPHFEKVYPALAKTFKEKADINGVAYQLGKLYSTQEINEMIGFKTPSLAQKGVQPTADVLFGGKVIFIQDPGTYSSAGMLVTDAVDKGVGIVIGTESAYAPTHYGDMLPWRLPNTGVQGVVSHKIFFRPDPSKTTESSIVPDVVLPYNTYYIDGTDAPWEWIKKNCQ